MKSISRLVYLIFIAVGKRYEVLKSREQLSAPEQIELCKLEKLMHHVGEIKTLLR